MQRGNPEEDGDWLGERNRGHCRHTAIAGKHGQSSDTIFISSKSAASFPQMAMATGPLKSSPYLYHRANR
jgi:hypothetical protein